MQFSSLGLTLLPLILIGVSLATTVKASDEKLRPPSVPLVLHDPYFSIWSPSNEATGTDSVHWTGVKQALSSTVWIDNKQYRILGNALTAIPALIQTDLTITPTQTVYSFEGNGVKIGLRFTTPTLPDNLDVLARPATYITFNAASGDGKAHTVRFHFGASAQIAAARPNQLVQQSKSVLNKWTILKMGTSDQAVLKQKGDSVRIDWGQFILSAKESEIESARFDQNGQVAAEKQNANLVLKPLKITAAKGASQWIIVAYDDEFSIQYFNQDLRPYWRRNGDNAESMLLKAVGDYSSLLAKCDKFDSELTADLTKAGGKKYAELSALAYRQAFAGCKLAADANGQPLFFPKENTSNGCIATSDVIYPMAPQFLLFGSALSRAMMVPIMDYASSSRWKFPFAPHDLGTYPQANGQVYGGGERTEENQMPVEESANMLILVAALAKMEGNADFAKLYWPTLTKWADYLKDKGFDPENQLCTDDFLGHQAHNVNLSTKAMIGIASYAQLCALKGDQAAATQYSSLAKTFAERWVKEASDGDHYRLTFDKPNTWSQKYNLVWDKILGLNLFPDSVRTTEMAYYRKMIKPFGLPLDNRSAGAKLDWSLWTATLTQNPDDFAAIMEPVYRFVNETPQRVGMGDWYDTSNSNHLFMHSRPVVGGVFLQMLYNNANWQKWASRNTLKAKGWAVIPEPPKITTIISAADSGVAKWRYSLEAPSSNWQKPAFDDTQWKQGESGFGTQGTYRVQSSEQRGIPRTYGSGAKSN